mgnify:CR=1 FL=1
MLQLVYEVRRRFSENHYREGQVFDLFEVNRIGTGCQGQPVVPQFLYREEISRLEPFGFRIVKRSNFSSMIELPLCTAGIDEWADHEIQAH